jgi:hypothetical protein
MSLAHAIQDLWPFRGPPDGRSDREIEDDLDAEFAFHLDQSARDLMSEGQGREAACGLAHERFGDIQRYKLQCRRIALKERIMLQRVNFILMIVVTLMVIGVGSQVWITQRFNTLALNDITAQLAKMRMDAAAEARDRGWSAPTGGSTDTTAKVLVEGAVDRPGWYDVITANGATLLHELLLRAGAQNPQSLVVLYTRRGETRSQSYDYDELQSGANKVVVGPGDSIRVKARSVAEVSSASKRAPTAAGWRELESGEWKQFDAASWKEVEGGATLLLLDSYDVRNTAGMPGGIVVLSNETTEIGVLFNSIDSSPTNLSLYEQSAGKVHRVASRWQSDDQGNLILNFAPLRSNLVQPLTFRRVRNADEQLDAIGLTVDALRQGKMARGAHSVAIAFEAEESAGQDQDNGTAPLESPDPLHRSSFRAVRWTDWTPFVDVQGQWYELLAVDTVPVSVLIEQARRMDAESPRTMFSERLIQVLQEAGRTVGDSLRLDLRELASGTKLSIGEAKLTPENYARVTSANEQSKAAGEQFPQFVQKEDHN